MYNEDWIREMVGTAIYNQGRQLFLNHRIQGMTAEDVFGHLLVEASVMGDINASSYSVSFSYDYIDEDIGYSCTCREICCGKKFFNLHLCEAMRKRRCAEFAIKRLVLKA